MSRRKRRSYTNEQKQAAVDLYREVGSMRQVSEELGVSDSSVSRWIRKAEQEGVLEPSDPEDWPAPSESEMQELERLRKEVKQLRLERELLKKAAAFFAKEGDSSSS